MDCSKTNYFFTAWKVDFEIYWTGQGCDYGSMPKVYSTPPSRTQFAETFEFVHTDFYCNAPFELFQLYAQCLDAERTCVNAIVNLFDIRRRQDVQRDRDDILVHYDEDRADRGVYDTLMEEVEANNRRLDVRTLYCSALENPAMFVAMLNAMVVRSVALMSSEQPP